MFSLLVFVLCLALSTGSPPPMSAEEQAFFKRVLETICVPNLSPDLAKKSKNCEKVIPEEVSFFSPRTFTNSLILRLFSV